MAKLTGQTIAASYDQLLIVGDADGITATAQAVESADDGGNASLLYLSTTEVYNPGTGGSNNTAFGINAGDALATNGDSNTVYGAESGTALSTADRNVAIGHNAFYQATTGADDNVVIGYNAMSGGFSSAAVDDCVIIGSGAGAGTLTPTATGTVAIGKSALAALTSGTRNIAIGNSAAAAITDANDNIMIGYEAGVSAEDAGFSSNIGIGSFVFDGVAADVDATANVAIGYLSMSSVILDAADHNVAIGYRAGFSTTAGTGNTMIGSDAGFGITLGTNNTAVGYHALDAEVEGTRSTAIGYAALTAQVNTGSGSVTNTANTAVGYNAGLGTTTGINNTYIGTYSANAMTTALNNVAIGKSAFEGQSGQAVQYCVAIGISALSSSSITTGANGTVAIGLSALASLTSGAGNVAVGYQAGAVITTGALNTAVGYQSLSQAQNVGNANTAVGYRSLYSVNPAADDEGFNTAMGTAAGFELTTGEYNTYIGNDCGYYNETGDNNVYVGHNAGVGVNNNNNSDNTAVGTNALASITTGSYNTCIGERAGDAITDGAQNVFIGSGAGTNDVNFTTGDSCVVIGHNADTSGVDAQNQIAIGQDCSGQANNSVTLGNASVSAVYLASGNTGCIQYIGDTANGNMSTGITINQGTADNEILAFKSTTDVSHSATSILETDTFAAFSKSSGTNGGLMITAATQGAYRAFQIRGTTDSATNTTKSTGGYGIVDFDCYQGDFGGVTTNGNMVSIGAANTTRFLFDNEGSGHADVEWTTYSDGRLKSERETVPYGLDEINQLKPQRYKRESGKMDGDGNVVLEGNKRTEIGFIAQEVKEIIPEIIKDVDESTSFYSLDDGKIVAVLVKAVQELSAKVKALEDA